VVEATESARGNDNEDAGTASYEKRMSTSEEVEEEAADADPMPDEDSSATDIGVRADYELPSVVKDRQEPNR
jgi:hypothetical protein